MSTSQFEQRIEPLRSFLSRNCRLSSIILIEIERSHSIWLPGWVSVGHYEGIIIELYPQFPGMPPHLYTYSTVSDQWITDVIKQFDDTRVSQVTLRLNTFDNLDTTLRSSVGEAINRLDDSNIEKLTGFIDGSSEIIQTLGFALKPLYNIVEAFAQVKRHFHFTFSHQAH
jgi:hypothetical protein